jgi:MFS family permease
MQSLLYISTFIYEVGTLKRYINPSEEKPRIWTRDFTLLALGGLCIAMANYFFSATMAIYAENISGSTAFAGLVTGAFYLASLGMRPINGLLVNRYGSRPLLIMSTLLCAIVCVLMSSVRADYCHPAYLPLSARHSFQRIHNGRLHGSVEYPTRKTAF